MQVTEPLLAMPGRRCQKGTRTIPVIRFMQPHDTMASMQFKPVSVVIPLYNKEKDVRRAIASAFAQTYPPAEIIVVDDGSTDRGADVVESLGDAHIRLERQPNAGVSAARNRGIAMASSELIAFLDADDEWMPDHLETIVHLCRTFPECQVFATSYMLRFDSHKHERLPIFRGIPYEPWEGVLEDYFGLAASSDPPLWSSAVAATRTALQTIDGFPIGIPQGEDLLTWARLAMRYKVAFCSKPSAVFWQPSFDDGQPTRRPEKVDLVAPGLLALLENAGEQTRPALRRYIGLWHKMRGTMFLRLGDIESARSELRCSWKFSGFQWRLAAYRALAILPPELARPSSGAIGRAQRLYRRAFGSCKSDATLPLSPA